MLTAMALASVSMTFAIQPRALRIGEVTVGDAECVVDDLPVQAGKQVWAFLPKDSGSLASSPLIVGDRVYFAATIGVAFRTGVVYCIDLKTGAEVWNTKATLKKMKNVSISSPAFADGKIYIGEGYHQDVNCKVYCLDAETGKEVWHFQTASHTESSPYVVEGKVYIGAGDDGLYCLNAASGAEVWHFNGLHIDANPVVAGNRLFVGAGVGDVHQEPAILCLATDTADKEGKVVWKHKLDLPAWGSPVVVGDLVYFGIGNGRFDEEERDPNPAGALLCVRAKDGEKEWRYDVPDGVLSRPTVDRSRVYFGSRFTSSETNPGANFYCLNRKTGKLLWKRDLGSPVVTAAALARLPEYGITTSVFVVTSYGQLYCFSPNEGRVFWSVDLSEGGKSPLTLWSSPAVVARRSKTGESRQILFGASVGARGSESPAVFCFEDRCEADPAAEPVESRP